MAKDEPSISLTLLRQSFNQQVKGNWALKFVQAFFVMGLISFFLKIPIDKVKDITFIGPILEAIHKFLVEIFPTVGILFRYILIVFIIVIAIYLFYAILMGFQFRQMALRTIFALAIIIGILWGLIHYMPVLLPDLIKQAPPVTQAIFGGP